MGGEPLNAVGGIDAVSPLGQTRGGGDMDTDRASARRYLIVALGVVGFAVASILSSPRCLLFIHWDNAAYLTDFGRGTGWNHQPWNVHFASGHVYLALSWPVRALGGGLVDGFRFANALFVGGTAALVADTALRLAWGCKRGSGSIA